MKKLICAVTVLAVSTARADTIYVDAANCPGPGNGSEADPYCSIQTAIDNAVDTDEILVAPGIYFETIDLLGKAITLRSTDGPEVTTIDGGASDCCFDNGSAGCDNAECEAIVCAIEPFCCDSSWISECADQARDLCGVCDPPVGSVVSCTSGEGAGTVLEGLTNHGGHGQGSWRWDPHQRRRDVQPAEQPDGDKLHIPWQCGGPWRRDGRTKTPTR